MKAHKKRRGAIVISAVTMLLFSVAAGAVGTTTYLYSSGVVNNQPPAVQVTSHANDDVLLAGPLQLKGIASDDGGKIRAVAVRVDGGSPIPATLEPTAQGSSWSVLVDVPDPGNHIIEVEVTDEHGKSKSTELSVIAEDTKSAITIPADEIIVEATEPSGASVDYPLPTTGKNIRILDSFDCSPARGSMFPIGTTIVNCDAPLANGDTIRTNFTISVRDTTPPVIVAPEDIVGKNSGMAFVKIGLGDPLVADSVDEDPSVSNDAPANGFPLGTKTIVWTATDDYGNTATAVQKVTITAEPTNNSDSSSSKSNSESSSVGSTTTYSSGASKGGGGGGSGDGSRGNHGGDDGNAGSGGQDGNNNGGRKTSEYALVINAVNMTGGAITGMPATLSLSNGTILQAGSTPMTFIGNSSYTITMSNHSGLVFDHWENGNVNPTREVTLKKNTTITAYYNDTTSGAGDTTAPSLTAAPSGGTYATSKSVTLSSNEPATTIYYTTNGNNPTTASTVYTSPIIIASTTTLKFIGKDEAGNISPVSTQTYVIDTVLPTVTASPLGGVYASSQSVTLTANKAATIYYTTNGNNPTTSSAIYSSPISISSTTTLKYFARDSAGNSGSIVTQVYTIDKTAPSVTASPAGGVYTSTQSVTLAASEQSAIYYTTNGNNPTTSSSVYSSPITVPSTTTLKYFARDIAGNSGAVATQTYTIDKNPPTVTASPAGGTYGTSQSITLTASEPATIYYTTNGNNPTTSSATYSSPISVTSTTTLKYFAKDAAGNTGTVVTEVYTIDSTAPTVTASPAGGTYSSTQSVTLTASEPAVIYYTTNGNNPTTSSTRYSSPISIASTTTLKYFSRDAAGNGGAVATQVYTINAPDTTPPAIAITQPAANSAITPANGNILITGTASDSGSGVQVVEVRVDDGSYIAATPKSPGDWSTWSVTVPITAGERRLVPRATDNAGNQAWNSIFITVNVPTPPAPSPGPSPPQDTVAPQTTINNIVDGSGTTIANGGSTTETVFRVTFSGSDNVGITRFEGRLDSGAWNTVSSPLTLNLAQGTHSYSVRSVDAAGNIDTTPASMTWTVAASPSPPSPEPPTESELDPFGIVKLYPTAPGSGNEYYTRTNAATTSEFLDNGRVQRMSGFSRNSDGTWNINGGPRWVITGGWRNVEMTMQLKINSGSQVQFYANGEEHTTNNNGAWHGSANKMRMYADGRIGFVKELYHESGNSGYTSTTATRSSGQGSIVGKWVTVKYVGYNIDNDTHRKLEGYISVNNDNKFIKVSEMTDNGNWYASTGFDEFMDHMRANYPNAVPKNRDTGQEMRRNEVITWEGTFVSFRCDGANYDFRNVSVREIDASNGLLSPSAVQ